MKLSSEGKIVFCKIALTISKKGHLTQMHWLDFAYPSMKGNMAKS